MLPGTIWVVWLDGAEDEQLIWQITRINFMEQSPYWECDSSSAGQEISSFTEPEGLLPCSQVPTNGPYPEPGMSHNKHSQ